MGLRNQKNSVLRPVFTELVWPFWRRSPQRWGAAGLLVLTILLIFAMVYSLVLMNSWNQAFYDALQKLDRAEFIRQLWRFFFIALASSIAGALKFFTLQRLALRWRTWMTEVNLQRWLTNHNYYKWQLSPKDNDNPDQRLSDDIFEFSDLSLEIAEKIFREAITFVSFIGILWGLSGSAHFTLFGWNIEFHRYLVVICLLYAGFGTWLVHRVGNPLASLHFLQQKFEADFRFLLVRLRENAESIALLRGEPAEANQLTARFRNVVGNFKAVIARQRDVILTGNVYGQFAYIFPFVVASPKVFTREITLGQLFQISSAFGQVQGSVSVVVDLYAKMARWYSVVSRLAGFLASLEPRDLETTKTPEPFAPAGTPGAPMHDTLPGNAAVLAVQNLTVRTPAAKTLLQNFSLEVRGGERVLLTAPSGSGKSSLVRSLNGLWPYSEGTAKIAPTVRSLVLQQNPYFPVASLSAVLSYPNADGAFTEAASVEALEAAGLPHLRGALSEIAHWSQRLSSGERQRLSLARAILHRPDVLFLDEATSALGPTAEAEVLSQLMRKLPHAAILRLGHPGTNSAGFREISLEPYLKSPVVSS